MMADMMAPFYKDSIKNKILEKPEYFPARKDLVMQISEARWEYSRKKKKIFINKPSQLKNTYQLQKALEALTNELILTINLCLSKW